MISQEQHARIRRLYFAEHWKVGTIATELGIHPDAVKRAIEADRFGTVICAPRPSMLDPFKPFILDTLDRHPRLRATRVYEMVRLRGFKGSYKTVRRYVCKVRPALTTEAYLALETMPGEQAQVDWARFGKLQIGSATRLLSLFVMVMSWSRAIYARFTLDQRMESFLRGHVGAFTHFGGVARTLLYDNLKSVVLDRVGDHVRFHPHILDFAGHYHFVPKPCAPYRGNEKGKVERAIHYVRHSFFAARRFLDVADLNAQLAVWLREVTDQRIRPTDPERRTVATCLESEREVLLPLPEHPFSTDLLAAVKSGKQPYVRFDTNRYSIPHVLVRKPLTLVISEDTVRVLDGDQEVARHARSYDRDQRIEDRRHLETLAGHKRQARELSGRDRLRALCPHADTLIEEMARRQEALRQHTYRLNQLLDRYGSEALDGAIAEALERGVPSASAIAHICDQRHRRTGAAPVLSPIVHSDPRIQSLRVVPHDLRTYDDLATLQDQEETDR